MKKILFCLALLAIAGTASAVSFHDVYDALLLDAELALEGKSDISLDSLTPITNKVDSLKQKVLSQEISEDEAVLSAIDIYMNREGLYCENLAQAIAEYNNHRVAKSDSLLLAQCTALECRINEIQSLGWTVPNRTQAKYDSLIQVRNRNEHLFDQERKRRLGTDGHYVTEYDGGTYVRIVLQDSLYHVHCVFPSPANPVDPRDAFISDGYDTNKTCRDGRHTGVDFANGKGLPIVAIGSGKLVQKSGNIAGKYAIINHPHWQLESMYAHGLVHKRKSGVVEHGETIMLEGSSGNTTGVHLHFELRFIDKEGTKHLLNPKLLFQDYRKRIVKDVLYLKKTQWGYKIISEKEFKEAEAIEKSVALE
jgi:murein DD-endopeptidase MepM/ murein hydrolase activator NlpD